MPKGVRLGGRKKGTPNKTTAALKDMVLNALTTVGGEAYLVKQASESPTAFMTLLGKVLPTQVSQADGDTFKVENITRRIVDAASD